MGEGTGKGAGGASGCSVAGQGGRRCSVGGIWPTCMGGGGGGAGGANPREDKSLLLSWVAVDGAMEAARFRRRLGLDWARFI
jgi:hypothetical protein